MKKLNFIIKLLVLVLFSAVESINAQTNVNKNFTEYSKEIQSKANAGDADAMGIMSSWLRLQVVAKENAEQAAQLAEKSDAMGSAFGTYECATLCETNNKVKSESLYKKAFPKLLELAKVGDCVAEGKLYSIYKNGLGTVKNPKKALEWLQKSADQGYAPSQTAIGASYDKGELGLEKNPQKAVEWYRKAADQGYAPAQTAIGTSYDKGELGLEKNPQKVVEWYRKAADQGYAPAQALIGLSYINGLYGTEKNYQKAVEWLQKSADQGFTTAQYFVGVLFFCEDTGTKNLELAYKYLTEASTSSDAEQANDAKTKLQQIKSDPEFININSKIVNEKIIASVSDPDNEKYGGPNTKTVIKFVTGQGQNNSNANMMAGLTAQLGNLVGVKYKEIKRGQPLESLGPQIPVGTKLFPIRIEMDANGAEQTTDYYFYKDEFGDWKAEIK